MIKIMIVDDDIQVTILLGKLLSMEGYQTTAVNDSSKAYEAALSVKPDLFLLDLMMPDPDGFKLCRILRADPNFILTPIFIITALDDNDSRVDVFGAGANEYFTKPFHTSELVQWIKRYEFGSPPESKTSRIKASKSPEHKTSRYKASRVITPNITRVIQEKLNSPDSFSLVIGILLFFLLIMIIIFWLLIKLLPPFLH